ncbi:hypothetical protein SEPCBS57363_000337 [Sporothrix epigloea]|uniref:SprT-like domain-containing protein n=1 Tax=Sporothrix epigloea TaxID=1892477 RepID=A0ABP0D457_9PEZI
MASWIRGGGEQPSYLSTGEKRRRPYYVDGDVHLSVHRPQEKRPYTVNRGNENGGLASISQNNKQVQHHITVRDRWPSQQLWSVDCPQLADCDVPYQSIEPYDTDAGDVPVFFVLHEERFTSTATQQSLTPQSPLLQNSHSPSPAPTNWSNGSDLKAHATDFFYGPHDSDEAQVDKTQRYEDWRGRNRQYGITQRQLESVQSSSFIALKRLPDARQIPSSTQLHPYARQRDRQTICSGKGSYDYDKADHQHASLQNDERSKHAAQTLSCPIKNHDTHNPTETMITDAEAATSVSTHLANFKRRCSSSRHERILLGLIHPKPAIVEFDLDNSALESIFFAANEIFFNGRLTRRVQWGWSDASSNPQYDDKIIGHTSLRSAQGGGFETFILLSTPILRSREYSRRLLISAFLHELIHCYLFICCGWSARESGGHTDGFRHIANTIDRWAGREKLFLCQVEADLEQFRQPRARKTGEDGEGQLIKPADEYTAYSLASPIFYNTVCSNTDTDWERCVHDRWGKPLWRP